MIPSDSRARTLPCWVQTASTSLKLDPLYLDCGAVAKHLSDALHDLIGVISHSDYGIGARPLGVRDHQVISLLPGMFGQIGIDGQVAAEYRLDRPTEVSKGASRSHRHAAHHSDMGCDAVSGEIIGRGDEHGLGSGLSLHLYRSAWRCATPLARPLRRSRCAWRSSQASCQSSGGSRPTPSAPLRSLPTVIGAPKLSGR